ncbi:MAG: hypothetical protein J6S43_01065 [Lentisphaeria bacterium]|nr:hypothetical protein [Lentisphaeria bacterium]
MAYLLKDIVLDAAKLPGNWQKRCIEIAAQRTGIASDRIASAEILSASVDSRRGTPKLLLTMLLTGEVPETPVEELAAFTVPPLLLPENSRLRHPVVIGTGPAGIFGALVLAMAGAEPVIIDRGSPVDKRVEDYRRFICSRELDPESNLLIGEGGAGTFSDGKLYTGTRDFRAAWVKKIMVECGAPGEIIWQKRAHAGSDNLAVMAANLRRKIEKAGGKFIFHTNIDDIHTVNGICAGVKSASGEIFDAPSVLLAPGLGGRELVRKLTGKVQWSRKPFQIGCRIEHPQELIDRAMYHMSRPEALGAAEYHLVSRRHVRHTASFCMCPGGEVVNASAWEKHSITNGMSCFARSGKFANSCLIATFAPEESGDLQAVDRMFDGLETRCFAAGGGDYTLPAQDAAAFIRREDGLKNRRNSTAVGVIPGRIDEIVPPELYQALVSGLKDFDSRIPGFIRQGKFIGVESCVSSPVRFLRDPETLQSSLPGLYCAGEGCGAAGGIISAACDGIRCAEKMLQYAG